MTCIFPKPIVNSTCSYKLHVCKIQVIKLTKYLITLTKTKFDSEIIIINRTVL